MSDVFAFHSFSSIIRLVTFKLRISKKVRGIIDRIRDRRESRTNVDRIENPAIVSSEKRAD